MDSQITVNAHVDMLDAFQPFDASFAEIYFETASSDLRLDTVAARSIVERVADPRTRVLVLTGDAGHGKTHLCAEMLAAGASMPFEEAGTLIRTQASGDDDLATFPDGRTLRIIKDLSEVSAARADELLVEAVQRDGRVTVICANEGRLRSVLTRNPALSGLLAVLDASITRGQTASEDGHHVVLNLNHQSVVSLEGRTLLDQVLDAWVGDPAKWTACDGCGAAAVCPIRHNREELNSDGVRSVLAQLLRVVERTGHVVTIRELLIFTAHLITGGLRCTTVGDRMDEPPRWQWPHLYHQVCFGDRVPPELIEGLDVFRGLRVLDPARRAVRRVDETLDFPDELGPFDPDMPPVLSDPVTHRGQARARAVAHRALWQSLRRRDFFRSAGDSRAPTLERLGLRHTAAFEDALATSRLGPAEVRKGLLRGLEALQGLHHSSGLELRLVDPAFSRTPDETDLLPEDATRTAVVAARVSLTQLAVMSESRAWARRNGLPDDARVSATNDVDWLDRHVVLSLAGPSADPTSCLELRLQDFEFVWSFGEGMRAWSFFEAEIRRILRRIGRLAESLRPPITHEVQLVSGDDTFRLIIEGDTILGGRG